MSGNERPKTVYLHAGRPKTASTSMQKAFVENARHLRACGIDFLSEFDRGIARIFVDDPRQSHWFAHLTGDEIDCYIRESKQRLKALIMSSRHASILISDEGITYLTEAEQKKLFDFITEADPAIRITAIIFVREYQSLLKSGVQQQLKQGRDLADLKQIPLNRPLVERLTRVFGENNVKVFPFEEAVRFPAGPANFLLNQILPGIELPNRAPANVSISCQAGELLSYINHIDPVRAKSKTAEYSEYRYPFDAVALPSIRGNKFRLPDTNSAGQPPYAFIREDNEWLKNTCHIDYTGQNAAAQIEKIEYGQAYFNDLVRVFPTLSSYLKKLTYDFIWQKSQEDTEYQPVFLSIREWIESHYAGIAHCEDIREIAKTEKKLMDAYARTWSVLRFGKAGTLNGVRFLLKHLACYIRYRKPLRSLFDPDYHLATYLPPGNAKMPPKQNFRVLHFLAANLNVFYKLANDPFLYYFIRTSYYGYNPNANVDIRQYIRDHPEIVTNGENALVHYIKHNAGSGNDGKATGAQDGAGGK